MRIAVVGGGLFGCTAAIHAARAGHDVTLHEAKPELMSGATAATYSRLHRGYHYPRSPATGRESRLAEASFRSEYGAAVIDGGRQFYIVPPTGSLVSAKAYRAFLEREALPYTEMSGIFEVEEPRVNLAGLSVLVRQKVTDAGVQVHLGAPAPKDLRARFDRVVVAAYSGLNGVLGELGFEPEPYKFQVVERPVVLLHPSLKDTSIVVIDGPFGCIDPLDGTPAHVLGHVTETVHAQNTGSYPKIPDNCIPVIDKGLIRSPKLSKYESVVDQLGRVLAVLGDAVHIGSSFTVRAVLANQEATDRRPTLVRKHDDQVISVFSGKLGTAVRAAREVLGMIEEREAIAA